MGFIGCLETCGLTGRHCLCRNFADGFPNLFVKDATEIRNRHVAFLASFHNPGTIFEQISVIYQLPRMFVGSFTLVLPYFPTGTAERVQYCRPCMDYGMYSASLVILTRVAICTMRRDHGQLDV